MKTILRVCALLCLLVGMLFALPKGDISAATTTSTFTHTQITNNGYEDYYPQVNGDYVVWQGEVEYEEPSGPELEYDIFLFQISTGITTQLTDSIGDEYGPMVDGDNVVWKGNSDGDYEIYHYTISTGATTKVTNNSSDDGFPQVDGDSIVWNSNTGGDNEIYHYAISTGTTTQVTTNTSDDYNMRVDGNHVVWQGNSDGDFEIYLYTISTGTTTKVSNNSIVDESPCISGNYISWAQYDDGNPQNAYLYNISNGTTAQIIFASASDPYYLDLDIDGDYVVLSAGDDGSQEIYLHQISTTTSTRITNDAPMDEYPKIAGNYVVWEKSDEIYLYEIDQDAISQLSTFPTFSLNYRPQVEGSYVTWYGSTGGSNPKEILLAGINIPTAPELTSPENGSSTYVETSPTFEWNAVTNAVSYNLEYSQDNTFATSTVENTANTTFSPGELAVGTWYWRVNASNGDTVSDWSEVWSHTINEMVIPTLISPEDGGLAGNYYPSFTWHVADGADRYSLNLVRVIDGATILDARYDASAKCDDTICEVILPGPLDYGDHQWRVRSWYSGTPTDWTAFNTFYVSLQKVQLRSPGVDAVIYGGRPTFKWYEVIDAASYIIEFYDATGAEDLLIASWQKNPVCDPYCAFRIPTTVGLTSQYGDYKWRVRAKWGALEGPWSELRTFTYTQLARTVQINPADGASTTDTTPTLEWTQIDGATYYILQIELLDETNILWTFVSDQDYCAAGVCSWDVPEGLLNPGNTYVWHVRAKNGRNYGRWSLNRSLIIQE